jgi:YidC/Oxa1 family membrane protein insertase
VGALLSGIGVLFQVLFTQPIFNALMLLYRLFGDFGLSIVVLTLIIRLVLFPLTLKQLKSSKAMQALQPQMQEIRRKYAKDQQAQMLAMQALQKEYGVNPLASGCLPLLIQLPVLYGMFFAFNTVLHSTHLVKDVNNLLYPFIAHFPDGGVNVNLNWFSWLNAHWSISLATPDPTHILPIIAALATFVQMRMALPKTPPTSKGGKSDTPDPMTSSMKTMQYIMPFITLWFGWSFPAGLALYWTVSAVFQAVQQYFVTGWGSLLVTPNIAPKTGNTAIAASASSNGATANHKESVKEKSSDDGENDKRPMAAATSGSVTSKTRSTTGPRPSNNGSSSQSGARRRNGSASARRRNTQRSRR